MEGAKPSKNPSNVADRGFIQFDGVGVGVDSNPTHSGDVTRNFPFFPEARATLLLELIVRRVQNIVMSLGFPFSEAVPSLNIFDCAFS